MKKNQIDEFVEKNFKKIDKNFHKSITNFETKYIQQFRAEVKRLKVFLHLINMESDDGLSYRITRRMKTVYGYFGIIRNLQMQLKKINEYAGNSADNTPVFYINILEKELEYWKKLSHDFIDVGYSFMNDKQQIMALLPDKLNKKSIQKFVYYTVYELNSFAGRTDDEALDSIRKFIEDIYYNYEVINPFFDEREKNFLNKKNMGTCLGLFDDFRNECAAVALLQTFGTDKLDEREKQLLKEMENEWLHRKKDLKNKVVAALTSRNMKATSSQEFAMAGIAS